MPSLIDKIVSEAKEYNKARVERGNAGEPTFFNTVKKIGHNILESHSQLADDMIEKVRDIRGTKPPKRKPILELTDDEQAFAELYYYIGNTYEFRQILTGTQSVAELAQEVEVRMDFFSFAGGIEALHRYRQTHVKPLLSDRMEEIMNQVDEAKALRANIEQEKIRLSQMEAAFLPNKKPQTSYSNMMEASIAYVQEQLDNAMRVGDGDDIVKYHDSLRLMKSALDAYNGVAPKESEQPQQDNPQGRRFNNQNNRKGFNRNNGYQNNRYQNNGYQNKYQNNGYRNNYQNNKYQNNGYQNNGYQTNQQNEGYQNNRYQNNGNRNNGYQNKFNNRNKQYQKNFAQPASYEELPPIPEEPVFVASGPIYQEPIETPQQAPRQDVQDERVFSFDEVDESTLVDVPRPHRPRDHKRRLKPIMTDEQFRQPLDIPEEPYTPRQSQSAVYEPDFGVLSDLDIPGTPDNGYGY